MIYPTVSETIIWNHPPLRSYFIDHSLHKMRWVIKTLPKTQTQNFVMPKTEKHYLQKHKIYPEEISKYNSLIFKCLSVMLL